jgi:hypothetical protein
MIGPKLKFGPIAKKQDTHDTGITRSSMPGFYRLPGIVAIE